MKKIRVCHAQGYLWTVLPTSLHIFFTAGFELKFETICAGLTVSRSTDTESWLLGLAVGDGLEPLGSVLLDVVIEDPAVRHQWL